MASYYKYVERNADSYVDWGAIGKSMSDMLQQENKVREEKKAAIDESSRQFGETLTNAPQGENKPMNQWTLEYANNAQQARLLQDKLLKSGQLKLKDYLVQRQNITDGTNHAFGLVKEYQSEYATKMEKYKSGKSQYLEQWFMAQAEGFSNFNNTNLYINPTDGTVSVGKMVKNPKTGVMELSKNPNDFTTVNALRNRIKASFDKYDVSANMDTFVETLGDELNVLYSAATTSKAGTATEVLNIMDRKALPKNLQGVVMTFEEAETKKLQSFLTNPYNVSSILTENVKFAPSGKQYDFTYDENQAKANDNYILLRNNEPQFSDNQKKQALEYLRLEARLRYDKKVGVNVSGQLQQAPQRMFDVNLANYNKEKLDADSAGQAIAAILFSDNTSDAQNASAYFGNQKIIFKKTGANLTVTTNKGTSSYNLSGANNNEITNSIVGALNPLGLNASMVRDAVRKYVGNRSLNLTTNTESFSPAPAPSTTLAPR
jgi:hypothetical protein